jgi:2-keto-4-pentenoate hydratase/2-oxohepta-3-ene-1,7-dioic acid hydratase in catechol pathway
LGDRDLALRFETKEKNMKYCRFISSDGPQYGLIQTHDSVEAVTQIAHDGAIPDFAAARKVAPMQLSSLALLAPVQPSKIICVGRNYADHAKEFGNEVPPDLIIFLKPPTSLLAPGAKIVRPNRLSQRVDFEGELAAVIGKTCHKVNDGADVRPYIAGYTCSNDVTARDLQRKDGQWTRGKSFDTFCPVGPVVTDEIDPWQGVEVETRVNGQVKQSASTTSFIFPMDVMIRFISQVMTLLPGDVIMTGTPAGVGPLVGGDEVAVSIQGIGTLTNPVVDGDAP